MIDLLDARGYTALHLAAFKGFEDITQILIAHVKSTINAKQITEWVNMKTTDDGFSALHFGSFRGNVIIIQALLDMGADMYARNNYGINVMHVAAQGDQPISMYYFKEKGMDLRAKDTRGSTPLHWVCYSKSEIALCYLLAWQRYLDDPDV